MKKPNFFVIGAPKCGTTSLTCYLSQHPNVFISPIKEPYFFNDDFPGNKLTRSLDDYLRLFEGAGDSHVAVGEGTTEYIYSLAALKNIKAFDHDAKIIVMLRNPMHMVVSLHQQWFHSLFEDQNDFKKAWHLQSERSKGGSIPKHCRVPEWLLYGWMGSYSVHIEKVFQIFPKQNVKVIIFDDFCEKTEEIFGEVLDFLGVKRIESIEFSAANRQREFSSKFSQLIAHNVPVCVRNMITRMRFFSWLKWIPSSMDMIFKTESNGKFTFEKIEDELFKKEVIDFFREDIRKLSLILDRDLGELWIQE